MKVMDSKIERIVKTAGRMFLQLGFRSVSMDDLASEIGISKKTIYKHFESKSKLIEVLVAAQIAEDKSSIMKIIANAKDPVHEKVEIGRFIYTHFKEMSPGILIELKKFYYDIWLKVDTMQNEFMFEEVTKNIQKGIELGLYRADIQAEFCAKNYVESVKSSCHNQSHRQNTEIYYLMLLKYHLFGIMTEKGRQLFQKYSTNLIEYNQNTAK